MYVGISRIEDFAEEEVWDISMPDGCFYYQDEHNFIAQNIVVHNSHAAGFCISPVPLREIAPLHVTTGLESGDDQEPVDGSNKTIATQFTASECESLGLIKFDVLGLLTKTVITLAKKLIHDRYGVDVDVDALPLDDKTTIKLLNSSKTDGIFQLEEPGMQRTIREIGIDTFNDLMAVIAMYRPGPLQFIPEYARRKRNPKSIKYLHPIVKKHTESTFGIVAYQEQCMQIFVDLAGQTTSDGYLFIKGAAKKKPELFNSMKDKFINGATKVASAEIANEVWTWLQPFSGYAFNSAHACSYAYEAWKTAYLKAHYPLEFMAARLSIAALDRKFDSVEKLEHDCQYGLGFRILPPHINDSKIHYSIVDEKTLRRSLCIKGVGDKAVEEIVKHQPYKSSNLIEDFASKVGSAINTAVIDSMCDAGLFGAQKKSYVQKTFETVKGDRKKTKGHQVGDLFS